MLRCHLSRVAQNGRWPLNEFNLVTAPLVRQKRRRKVSQVNSSLHKLLLSVVVDDDVEPNGNSRLRQA